MTRDEALDLVAQLRADTARLHHERIPLGMDMSGRLAFATVIGGLRAIEDSLNRAPKHPRTGVSDG